MPKYFDIHSHLNFPDYKKDSAEDGASWEEVIGRLKETETHTIVVGTDFASSKSAVELAEKYEEIYACVGVHPVDDLSADFDVSLFSELVKHPKVVAVGECGLDFFRTPRSLGEVGQQEFERQKKLFMDQVEFALEHDKPLMIHSRSAYPELLEMLEPLSIEHGSKLRGNIHFFAGTLEEARRFWNIGFTTSFTGVITFTHDYDEVIKRAPIEMIMSETDSPFVAPVPYRGKRNEPSYVSEVVKKIAEIRGEDEEIVQKTLLSNAFRVFNILA